MARIFNKTSLTSSDATLSDGCIYSGYFSLESIFSTKVTHAAIYHIYVQTDLTCCHLSFFISFCTREWICMLAVKKAYYWWAHQTRHVWLTLRIKTVFAVLRCWNKEHEASQRHSNGSLVSKIMLYAKHVVIWGINRSIRKEANIEFYTRFRRWKKKNHDIKNSQVEVFSFKQWKQRILPHNALKHI